jgi:DNA excision repair protein ERCC-4
VIPGVRTSRVRSTAPLPFTVVVDTREQRAYPVPGAITAKLEAGDYSILGLESIVAVERKSLADLFGTVGAGRKRFEAELAKLAKLRYSAIVIEGDFGEMFNDPPKHSKTIKPQSIAASLIAWSVRFNVHVWFGTDRENAYAITLHILEKFWKESQNPAPSRVAPEELLPGQADGRATRTQNKTCRR